MNKKGFTNQKEAKATMKMLMTFQKSQRAAGFSFGATEITEM